MKTKLKDFLKPRKEKVSPVDYPKLPYVGLEHIEAQTTRLLETANSADMKSAASLFKTGDVLYSRLRPYLNKVWLSDRDGLCSAEFMVFPPNKKFDADFLRYRLNSQDFVSFANSLDAGDRPRVNFEQIGTFETWLPESLEEQKAIAVRIEEALSRLDASVAALRRVQAQLKRYRTTVLKAACEGKLGETGEKNWIRCTLGDVIESIDSGKSFRCEERPPRVGEYGVAKVSAVTWNYYNEIESKTCTDPAKIEKRYLIKKGDFIFSRANTIDLVGACVIVSRTDSKIMLSDKLLRFKFKNVVLPDFVLLWVRSKFGREEIERLSTGNQESMRNIGQERIRAIQFKLPPLDEQKIIVKMAEMHWGVVRRVEVLLEKNFERILSIRRAILAAAFSGQ